MITCKECSKYGKVQKQPRPSNNKKVGKKHTNSRKNNKYYSKKPQKPEYELVEDYNKLIRQAREKLNITQKKLGEKIYERESVIAHIESGKMVPDTKLAHKLEKILKIKLIEQVSTDDDNYENSGNFRGTTIGDIVRIKK
jgi:putative transcription factor